MIHDDTAHIKEDVRGIDCRQYNDYVHYQASPENTPGCRKREGLCNGDNTY